MSFDGPKKSAMEEYLKRYLSKQNKEKKKKRKEKPKNLASRMKIYEDDAFIPVQPGTSEIPSDEDEKEDLKREIELKLKLAEKAAAFKKGTFHAVEEPVTGTSTTKSDRPLESSMSIKHEVNTSDDEDVSSTVRKQDLLQPLPRTSQHGSRQDRSSRKSLKDSFVEHHDLSQPEHTAAISVKQEYNSASDHSTPRQRHLPDSDHSPPRRRRRDSDHSPSRKQRHDFDSDRSPPRRRHRDLNLDHSPPRKQRRDSGLDHSPPRRRLRDSDRSPSRKQHRGSGSDHSPPRRRLRESDRLPSRKHRHDSDSDHSPPRRRRHDSDSDHLPPREKYHDSGSDHSPPRRRFRDSDRSPSRKQRHDSDSDHSPPRRRFRASDRSPSRKQRHDSDSDHSPPRRSRHDSDHSSPRKQRLDSDSDHSTSRRRRHDSEMDRSSSKRYRSNDSSEWHSNKEIDFDWKSSRNHEKTRSLLNREHGRNSVTRYEKNGIGKPDVSKNRELHDGKNVSVSRKQLLEKTLEGKKAGLHSAKDVREEMLELKKKEEEMFANLDEEISGRNATAVHRKKLTGKHRETREERERKEREAKKQQELEEKYKKWNRGIRQIEKRTEDLNEMARVAQEEFARSADNEAMNKHLKEVIYKEDPMIEHVKKKKLKKALETGEVYPTYQGSWPPNRFSIPPGYRWDGVDRSNGFEGKIAQVVNRKVAQDREYYENISKYE